MPTFSIRGAAFSGFIFAREKPLVILVWFLFSLILAVGQAWLSVVMVGDTMTQLQALQAHPDPANASAILGLLGKIIPFYGVVIVIALLTAAVTSAAAARSVLRPEPVGIGYLGFGGDELRMLVVSLVIGIIIGVVYIIGLVITEVIALVASGAINTMRTGAATLPPSMFIIWGLAFLPVLAGIIALGVKFSMASAQTVDSRSISIFGSWGVTAGHFWRILGAYLLSVLLFLPVALLGMAVVAGAAVILGGGLEAARALMSRADMSSMLAYFTPLRIIFMVIGSIYTALALAVFGRTPAVIYAQLTERDHADVF